MPLRNAPRTGQRVVKSHSILEDHSIFPASVSEWPSYRFHILVSKLAGETAFSNMIQSVGSPLGVTAMPSNLLFQEPPKRTMRLPFFL